MSFSQKLAGGSPAQVNHSETTGIARVAAVIGKLKMSENVEGPVSSKMFWIVLVDTRTRPFNVS